MYKRGVCWNLKITSTMISVTRLIKYGDIVKSSQIYTTLMVQSRKRPCRY